MKTEEIQKLLDDVDANLDEIDRVDNLLAELTQEDARLLKTITLDDPVGFKTLSDLRLKKEICQSKIPQLQARLASLQETLRAVLDKSIPEFNSALGALVELKTRTLAKAIEPWVFEKDQAYGQAQVIAKSFKGPIGNLLGMALDRGYDGDPIQVSNRLLANWSALSETTEKGS